VKAILENCDKTSIVLIDEYARATSNLNGLCLFRTLVDVVTDKDFLSEIQE